MHKIANNTFMHMGEIVCTILIIILFLSCSNQAKKNREDDVKLVQISDTIIGRKIITDQIPGSSYRNRATGYYIVVNKDTSEFMPIISEFKDNGAVHINQIFSYSDVKKTYFQKLRELELILPAAAQEYDFDSLSTMSIGRIILTGDLAIMITEEFKSEFGNKEKIATTDYKAISDFLLESSLAKNLNEVLKPYSKSVSRIPIEKVFFTDKEVLLSHSKVLRDSTEIPDKILDFNAWIEFRGDSSTVAGE